jgi:lysyl-tRNA synthetase class 2
MANWKPSAAISTLQLRAKIYQQIRQFFAEKNVLEVETPLMSHAAVTDPHLASVTTNYQVLGNPASTTMYLHTSPEYGMKRLLAAGSGCIYQICKVFRNGEVGRYHNPEFTMLEWYRLGFNHHQLMDEMDELLQHILRCGKAERLSYQQAFLQYLSIDPLTASAAELRDCAHQHNIQDIAGTDINDKDLWLQLLMSDVVEPQLGKQAPTFIYDFPASQAALAQVNHQGPHPVAERFEVYMHGIELANGFHELADAKEQQRRFEADLIKREQLGYPQPPMDKNLLSALAHGFPDCAGVALGIDRLIMLAGKHQTIAEVLTFPHERA